MCLEIKETTLLTGSVLVLMGFVCLFVLLSPSYIMYRAAKQGRNTLDREMKRQQGMVRSEKLNVCRKPAYNVN